MVLSDTLSDIDHLSEGERECIEGIQSIDQADIDFWQGRLRGELVDDAVAVLVDELH